jgi:hypothetical protein
MTKSSDIFRQNKKVCLPPVAEIREKLAEQLALRDAGAIQDGYREGLLRKAELYVRSEHDHAFLRDHHRISEALKGNGRHQHWGEEIQSSSAEILSLLRACGYETQLVNELEQEIFTATVAANTGMPVVPRR